jgi:hypothetical protein
MFYVKVKNFHIKYKKNWLTSRLQHSIIFWNNLRHNLILWPPYINALSKFLPAWHCIHGYQHQEGMTRISMHLPPPPRPWGFVKKSHLKRRKYTKYQYQKLFLIIASIYVSIRRPPSLGQSVKIFLNGFRC